MAIATGATVFGDEAMDVKLEQLQMHDFGEVGEVVVTKDDTLMLNGKGSLADIEARVIQIDDAIENSNSEYEKVGGWRYTHVVFEDISISKTNSNGTYRVEM